MSLPPSLPGTPQHQSLLRCILDHYRADPRIRSVVVFGSLGRGNWDALSDLDLDVIVADGASIDVPAEFQRLCASFAATGERCAIFVPDGSDAGDLVFDDLAMISIRFHTLDTTKHAIVDGMIVLSGSLDAPTIAAAGVANQSPAAPLSQLLDPCVRYAAVASVFYRRGQLWAAVEVLHRMRALLMDIFARARGGFRGYQTFTLQASPRLQSRLAAALPALDPVSVRASLEMLLDILTCDLDELSSGQLSLSDSHKIVLSRVQKSIS